MVVPDFTIEKARKARLSDNTRDDYKSGINQIKKWARHTGQHELLKACNTDVSKDGQTLDLAVFQYHHFTDFLEWTMINKTLEIPTISGYRSALQSLYKDHKVPLPVEFGDDIKEIYSGNNFDTMFRYVIYIN